MFTSSFKCGLGSTEAGDSGGCMGKGERAVIWNAVARRLGIVNVGERAAVGIQAVCFREHCSISSPDSYGFGLGCMKSSIRG